MLVFVDESGDSGMRNKPGSSALFIITAILFDANDSADACDATIARVRRELRMNPMAEFHFNKCRNDLRTYFLEAVSAMDFRYISLVLEKAKLYSPEFIHKDALYKFATQALFENAKPYLNNATITLDRSGDREFTRELGSYLKEKINSEEQIIRKVKSEPSHANNLLQLADMVCGAVARSYRRDKEDSTIFRRMLSHRELSVQAWPKN